MGVEAHEPRLGTKVGQETARMAGILGGDDRNRAEDLACAHREVPKVPKGRCDDIQRAGRAYQSRVHGKAS